MHRWKSAGKDLVLVATIVCLGKPAAVRGVSTSCDDGDSPPAGDGCLEGADLEHGLDVIGNYVLHNEKQCRKLCWSRALCSSFSCRAQQHTTGGGHCVRCVLHSSHVQGGSSGTSVAHAGWSTVAAGPGSNPSRPGCDARPCGPTDVCVPTPTPGADGHRHLCLPLPALCPSTPLSAACALEFTGDAKQDDVITVPCREYYVTSPKNASTNMMCQVNSRWTVTPGECLRAEYFNQSAPCSLHIPWCVEEGWGACVEGKFGTADRVTFKFVTDSENNQDISFIFSMRTNSSGNIQGVIWDEKVNGAWQGTQYLNRSLHLQPDNSFILSFRLLETVLVLRMAGYDDFVIPAAPTAPGVDGASSRYVNMSGVQYLSVSDPAAQLDYVNLLSHCP